MIVCHHLVGTLCKAHKYFAKAKRANAEAAEAELHALELKQQLREGTSEAMKAPKLNTL